jgi:hypothetical protein
MTDFIATTILILANASGDMFVVEYLYGGKYRYRMRLDKSADPVSVVELYNDKDEYEYMNEIGDNLRCCVEGFYYDGFNIVVRDEGDLTDYYLQEEDEEEDE